jgi:hypothetical protein
MALGIKYFFFKETKENVEVKGKTEKTTGTK